MKEGGETCDKEKEGLTRGSERKRKVAGYRCRVCRCSLSESAAVLTGPIVPQGVAEADTDVGRLIVSKRDAERARGERVEERERDGKKERG